MAEQGPVTAKVLEAGDLEYKVFVDNVTFLFGEGRWQTKGFPHAMLIQFASEEDAARAMKEGIIKVDR